MNVVVIKVLTKYDKYVLTQRYLYGIVCNFVTIRKQDNSLLYAIIPSHWEFYGASSKPCGNPGMGFYSTLYKSFVICDHGPYEGEVLDIIDYSKL